MNHSLIIFIAAIASISMAIYWFLYTKKRARACHIHTPNGIDKGEYVTISGIQQFLYHRGENKDRPVLLFLHWGLAVRCFLLPKIFSFLGKIK